MNLLNCIWPPTTHRKPRIQKKPLRISGTLADGIVIPSSLNFKPANCLIVGGGVCGLWFALHLKAICPHFAIEILETAPIVYPQTQILLLNADAIDSYLDWKPAVSPTNTIRIDDLRAQLEHYLLGAFPDIRILRMSFDNRIADAPTPFQYVFGIDGVQSKFYNTFFNTKQDAAPCYTYYVELAYRTAKTPTTLAASQLSMVKSNIAAMRNLYEMVYDDVVILRLELQSTTYFLAKNATAQFATSAYWMTYLALPIEVRKMLNFWMRARQYFLKETIVNVKPSITFFDFPIYSRTPIAEKHDNYFLLGAAAFQLDLEHGLEQSLCFAAISAMLFTGMVINVREEFMRKYAAFVAKQREDDVVSQMVTVQVPVNEVEGWREDFIVD